MIENTIGLLSFAVCLFVCLCYHYIFKTFLFFFKNAESINDPM